LLPISHFETLSSLTRATTPAVSTTPSLIHAPVAPTTSTAGVDALCQLIISTLGITTDMLDVRSDCYIRTEYQRWRLILEMFDKAGKVTWPQSCKPQRKDIVAAFGIKKSQFYEFHNKIFPSVNSYPDMKAWLAEEAGAVTTIDLWDDDKDFGFGDLQKWMKLKSKGKGKARMELDQDKAEVKVKGDKKKKKKSKGKDKV